MKKKYATITAAFSAIEERLKAWTEDGWSVFQIIPLVNSNCVGIIFEKGVEEKTEREKFLDEIFGWEYSAAEKQSGLGRVSAAEGLILQLKPDHNGRNTWLLNYGRGGTACAMRAAKGIKFIKETLCAQAAN